MRGPRRRTTGQDKAQEKSEAAVQSSTIFGNGLLLDSASTPHMFRWECTSRPRRVSFLLHGPAEGLRPPEAPCDPGGRRPHDPPKRIRHRLQRIREPIPSRSIFTLNCAILARLRLLTRGDSFNRSLRPRGISLIQSLRMEENFPVS